MHQISLQMSVNRLSRVTGTAISPLPHYNNLAGELASPGRSTDVRHYCWARNVAIRRQAVS